MKLFRNLRPQIRATSQHIAKQRSQAGQSVAEFALIAPMLLLLVLGVIEIGRFAYISILVGNAARAGAAYGSQGLARSADLSGITLAANNDYLSNGSFTSTTSGTTTTSTLTVSASTNCGCDSGGTITSASCGVAKGVCSSGAHWVVMLNVTAHGSYAGLFSYPGIPHTIDITNTAKMQVRQD